MAPPRPIVTMMASRHPLARAIQPRHSAPLGLRNCCLVNSAVSASTRRSCGAPFVTVTRRFTSSSLHLFEVPKVPQGHIPPFDIPLPDIPTPSSQSLIDSLSAALAAQSLDLHLRLGLLRVLQREGQYARLVTEYEALALRGDGMGEDLLFHKEAGDMYDSALMELGMGTRRAEAKARRKVLGVGSAEGAGRVPGPVRLMGTVSEGPAALSAAFIPQPLYIYRPQNSISPSPSIDIQRYLSDVYAQIQHSADPARRRLLGRATPRNRRDLLTKFVPPEARLGLASPATSAILGHGDAQHPWLHDDIGVAIRSTNDLAARLQRVLDLSLSHSALQPQAYPLLSKWYEVEGGLEQLLGPQEGWHAEEESAVVTSYLAHLANKVLGDPANFIFPQVASPPTEGDNERAQPAHWSRVPGSPDLLLAKEGENVALLQWADPVYGDNDGGFSSPLRAVRSSSNGLSVNRLCNGNGPSLGGRGITRDPILLKLWASMHQHRTRLSILHDGTSSIIVRLASPFCLEVSKVIDRHSMEGFPPPAGHLPHPHVHSWTHSPAKDLIPEVNVLSAMVAMGMDTSRLATKGLQPAEDLFLGIAHYSCDDTDKLRASIKVDMRRDDRSEVDDYEMLIEPMFPDRVITKDLDKLRFQRVPETRKGPLAPHISLIKCIGSGRTWDAYEGIMSNTDVQRKGRQKAALTIAGDMESNEPFDPSTQTRVAVKLTETTWFDRVRNELDHYHRRGRTTREAKLAVLNEARIYQDDLASLQGFALPKFYGLWKAEVAGKEYYAIVLELLGESVRMPGFGGEWKQVSDDNRIDIFKAYSAIHRKGICHADVELRHIRYPLPPATGGDKAASAAPSTREDALRLRVIDFEGAVRIHPWSDDYRKRYMDSEKKTLARDLGAEDDVWEAYEPGY